MRIRKGFLSIALERAKKLDFAWLGRQALKYRAIRKDIRRADGIASTGPVIAHFFCTRKCNLRCPMCDIPCRPSDNELSTAQAFALIDQLAALKVSGVSFTGGEPLLRPDIFALMKRARSLGLDTLLVTNGLLIDRCIPQILDSGAGTVNVSIDGSTPGIHDRSRGKTGAFEKTSANIRLLAQASRENKAGIKIVVSTVISKDNAADLGNIPALCRFLGADRVIFCPVHEFGPGKCRIAPIDLAINLADHPDRDMIDNSDGYLHGLKAVLQGEPPPAGCRAGHTTLIIDPEGGLYPCKCYFETGRPLAQWRPDGPDMDTLWHSVMFNAFRKECGTCRECYLTLNREFDGLFR